MFLEAEIAGQLNKLKNRKAPGTDDISNELLKYGGPKLTAKLTNFINRIRYMWP